MHVYQGYKYDGYGGGGQRETFDTSKREQLEKMYSEAHSSTPAHKPRLDWTPFAISLLSMLVSGGCLVAWMYGYDMIVPLLAALLVMVSGYIGWRMVS